MTVTVTGEGDTAIVTALNVEEVVPPYTVTVPGTVAYMEFELKLITIPPLGAVPLSVTLPVVLAPPITEAGLNVMVETVGGLTVITAGRLTPRMPVILAVTTVETGIVLTVNVAEVINAGTVTEGGTVIPPLFDDKVTTAPAEGA